MRARLVGVVAALLLLGVATPPAAAAPLVAVRLAQGAGGQVATGLTVSSTSLYVVDDAANAVHVSVDTTITNTSPPTGRYYSYFDAFALPLVPEATAIAASRDGANLSVSLDTDRSPIVSIARVHLSPVLLYGQTQVLHLTYDIPGQPARSPGATRGNAAFVTFPVFVIADPDQADVEVDVPHRFAVELVGDQLDKQADGDTDRYTAKAIANPLDFNVFVAASDETKLATRSVDASDATFTVHAWPDDVAWGDFVANELGKGVPALVQEVGLPFAVDDVAIFETATPYLYGYAGWYERKDHRIDVGDELDPLVVIHEISHTWFNDQLVNTRWVEEGLAQEFAAETVRATGGTADDPTAPDPAAPGAVKLSVWSQPDVASVDSFETEQFGYNASFAAIHAIVTELGPDKTRAVLKAASDHLTAYPGTGAPEKGDGGATWKQFLDLVDEVGGATQADQVVRDLVATPADVTQMDARDKARAAYRAFVGALDGWGAPLAVRSPLGRWSFDIVDDLIARATTAKASSDEIVDELAPLGVEPDALRNEYESAQNLDRLDDDIAALKAASDEVVKADRAVHGGHGPLQRIGLIGASAASHLRAAESAVRDGDATKATHEAKAAERIVDAANKTGALRIAAVVALIVAVLIVRRVARRRRARRVERAQERERERDAAAAVPAMAGGSWWAPPTLPADPPTAPPMTDPLPSPPPATSLPPPPPSPPPERNDEPRSPEL